MAYVTNAKFIWRFSFDLVVTKRSMKQSTDMVSENLWISPWQLNIVWLKAKRPSRGVSKINALLYYLFLILTTSLRLILLPDNWGNLGMEKRLCDLPTVRQLPSGRTGIWIHICLSPGIRCWSQNHYPTPPPYCCFCFRGWWQKPGLE